MPLYVSNAPSCFTYSQVYKYYRSVAELFQDKNIRILKTDCHNESGLWEISIPLVPVLANGNDVLSLEIDPKTLEMARRNYPEHKFIFGDIRNLDTNQHFDLVLDFSTIDHVNSSELAGVLRNYRKIGNSHSIIVWLSKSMASTSEQTYFDPDFFRLEFEKTFGGDYSEIAVFSIVDAELVHFVVEGEKKFAFAEAIKALAQKTRQENLRTQDFQRTPREIEVEFLEQIDLYKNQMDKCIETYQTSWSWRLSLPLRALGKLLVVRKTN